MEDSKELKHRSGWSAHIPRSRATFYGLLAVGVACVLLLLARHQSWVFAPNDHILGGGYDGVKNYMTTAWHVERDEGYVHYDGMNYPFGEHVLFTDNQPIFSTVLQWWHKHLAPLTGKTVGILNIFLLASVVLGSIILFLFGRKLHLPVWYAGLIALGMTFLSPQMNRMYGHFGLSHIFVIPLMLYLLCLYEERTSRRYQSLLIGLLVWVAAQLHFYYLGVAALFLTFYIGFQILRDFSKQTFFRRMSHWVIMVLLPFTLLNGWLHWSDFASDRPKTPYGLLAYLGTWEGVFLPYDKFPLYQWIDQLVVPIRRVNGEGIAYVGLVATVFTIWLIFRRFRMFSNDWSDSAEHRVHKHFLIGIFVSALAMLLFSCGFPFAIPGMEWMIKYLGPIKQFRSLGRFTWIYFYVGNFLAFYTIWNYSKRMSDEKKAWVKWVLPGLALLALAYESIAWQNYKTYQTHPNFTKESVLKENPNHWVNQHDFNRYQALLPLPYYHMGSESVWFDLEFELFKKVQTTALFTGVPDMGVNMSRTPIHQTIESIQLVLIPGETPTMLNELPDNRPIAILLEPHQQMHVFQTYPHLMNKARLELEHPDILVYSLYPDSVRAFRRELLSEIQNEINSRSNYRFGEWYSSADNNNIFYQSFDSITTSNRRFQGAGAYSGNMGDTTILMDGTLAPGRYYATCWIYGNQNLGLNHELKILEENPTDGTQIRFQHEGLHLRIKSIINGWALFEVPFEIVGEDSRLKIYLHKLDADQEFVVDEFLVKLQDVGVYRDDFDWLVRNNFWYRK